MPLAELRFAVPPLVEVAGGSMAPSLPRGSSVRVVAATDLPQPGAVALLQTASGLLLHRVVHRARFRSGDCLFHRGDAGGRVGLATPEAVVGVAIAVLQPKGACLPLETAPAFVRRSFRQARLRCRAYALVRRLGERLGCYGTAFSARCARRLAALLL